jgi:hypothetical protein
MFMREQTPVDIYVQAAVVADFAGSSFAFRSPCRHAGTDQQL